MIPKRAKEITPFLVMDVLERANDLERQDAVVFYITGTVLPSDYQSLLLSLLPFLLSSWSR